MENSKCWKRSNEPGRVCSSCGGSGRANAHGDCMACGGTGRAVVVSMPIQQPAPPPAEQATEGVPPRIKCKRCRESIVSFQVCELANGDKPYCIDCERHLRLSPAEQAVVAESATTEFDALRAERDHYVHEASRLARELEAAEAELSNAHRLARKNARLAGATRRCLVGFLEDFPRYFGKNDNALLDAAHETRAALTELWKESDQSRPSTAARSGSVGGEARDRCPQCKSDGPPLGHGTGFACAHPWHESQPPSPDSPCEGQVGSLWGTTIDDAKLDAKLPVAPITIADVDRRIAELARAAGDLAGIDHFASRRALERLQEAAEAGKP